jgi:ankyrin repeat protein
MKLVIIFIIVIIIVFLLINNFRLEENYVNSNSTDSPKKLAFMVITLLDKDKLGTKMCEELKLSKDVDCQKLKVIDMAEIVDDDRIISLLKATKIIKSEVDKDKYIKLKEIDKMMFIFNSGELKFQSLLDLLQTNINGVDTKSIFTQFYDLLHIGINTVGNSRLVKEGFTGGNSTIENFQGTPSVDVLLSKKKKFIKIVNTVIGDTIKQKEFSDSIDKIDTDDALNQKMFEFGQKYRKIYVLIKDNPTNEEIGTIMDLEKTPKCIMYPDCDDIINEKYLLYQVLYKTLNDKTEEDEDKFTLEKFLTKKSCKDKNGECNLAYKPYNELLLYGVNKDTGELYNTVERARERNRLDASCGGNSKNSETYRCCDQKDHRLNNIIGVLPDEFKNNIKRISVDKTCDTINKISVCNSENIEDCDSTKKWIEPEGYHYCKLLKAEKEVITGERDYNSIELTPDCYENKCNNYVKYLDLEDDTDKNEIISDHYYLIEAVKKDDLEYIKNYFMDINKRRSVNDKLEYGYSGNTIFHTIAYYNARECAGYMLSTNYDYSLVNKDGNNVLHIAGLKGNYDLVNNILVHGGSSVECTNKYGDTALHSAVRSGSFNSVKILLNNGGSGCVDIVNKLGETPLHVAAVSKRKNFKVVELLVNYGSNIHNINKNEETILKSLMGEEKTVAREEIRTFLQKIYYYKYDTEEYNKLLNDFPEIRPISLDREINDNLRGNFDKYSNKIDYKDLIHYDDDMKDNKLYVKKRTRGLKDKIPKKYYEGFDGENIIEIDEISKDKLFIYSIFFLIIFIILIFFVKKLT